MSLMDGRGRLLRGKKVAGVLLFTAFISCAASARAGDSHFKVPSQRELNGFLLGQYSEVIANSLGDQILDEKTPDGWRHLAYSLNGKRSSYMAFKFTGEEPNEIFSIQIAGGGSTEMQPFAGVRLGDPKATVLETFGGPSAIKHNDELDLDLYVYEGRNYSFEMNSKGRLSSIQIFGYEGFQTSPGDALPSMAQLYDAVAKDGPEALLDLLSAKVEVYDGQKTIRFTRAARLDLSNPASPLSLALRGKVRSLRSVAEGDRAQGDGQLRIFENKPGFAYVYKFPAHKLLKEVVFVFEAGGSRVWEIQYR